MPLNFETTGYEKQLPTDLHKNPMYAVLDVGRTICRIHSELENAIRLVKYDTKKDRIGESNIIPESLSFRIRP